MSFLTDPGTPIDIAELNTIVNCISHPTESISTETANQIIEEFLKRDDAFHVSIDIISNSDMLSTTKHIAFKALENVVILRWRVLEDTTKSSIKTFLFDNILRENACNLEHGNVVEGLRVLVQILVNEWPEEWPDFFPTLLELSTTNVWATKHAFMLFSLFSEEILDQTKHSVTSTRAHEMKLAMTDIIPAIMECIAGVFENCQDTEIVKITIQALSHLVKFVDTDIITSNPVICQQLPELMKNPQLTIPSITVLTAIISSINPDSESGEVILQIFVLVIQSLSEIIGDSFLENASPESKDSFFQVSFVSAISAFLSNMPVTELDASYIELVQKALQWITELTSSTESMVSDACIDFWTNNIQSAFLKQNEDGSPPVDLYLPYIEDIQRIVSEKIDDPFTFHEYIDEFEMKHIKAEFSQKSIPSTEKIWQFLKLLTHINMESMAAHISAQISHISEEFSVKEFLSLSSVLGAVAEHMVEAGENDFFFETAALFQSLIDDNEEIEADQKCFIVQGFAFICCQYAGCLNRSVENLYQVVKKLIEYLIATSDEEVQTQMAILLSFPPIINKCSALLLRPPPSSESQPEPSFLQYLFENFGTIIDSISFDAKLSFFSILLLLIQRINLPTQQKECLKQLLDYLDEIWSSLSSNVRMDDQEYNLNLFLFLQYHSLIPQYLRTAYDQYLIEFVPVMVELYKQYADGLVNLVRQQIPPTEQVFLSLKTITSQILILFTNSVQNCFQENKTLNTIFVPAYLPILDLYADQSTTPIEARTPQMLSWTTQLVVRLPNMIRDAFPDIFHKLILPVMNEMIAETSDFPDFIKPFFELIVNVMSRNPLCILTLGEEAAVFLDFVKFGCECDVETVYKHCFDSLVGFYSYTDNQELTALLNDTTLDVIKYAFNALTSLSRKAAFDSQVNLIRKLIISPAVQERVDELLQFMYENYPSLGTEGTRELFEEMIKNQRDPKEFRILIRNFLVDIRSISIDDPDLKKDEMKQQSKLVRELYKQIPGGISPDDDQTDDSEIDLLKEHIAAIRIT